MRKFKRVEPAPETLSSGEGYKTQQYNLSRAAGVPVDLTEHWSKPDVLGALQAMSGRGCAWCGVSFAGTCVSVEHWRPKKTPRQKPKHGGYWWLAYTWENLFLACGRCQTIRGSSFPVMESRAELGESLGKELPLLIHPELLPLEEIIIVEPEGWPAWSLRSDIPPEAVNLAKIIVQNSIRVLKLRDMSFTDDFNSAFNDAYTLAENQDWSSLQEKASRFEPFSFAYSLVLKAYKQCLPSVEQEKILFCSKLMAFWQLIGSAPDEEVGDSFEKDRILIEWALAYLCLEGTVRSAFQEQCDKDTNLKALRSVVDTHRQNLENRIAQSEAESDDGGNKAEST